MSTTPGYGVAGRVASFFLDSKITPLLIVASLLLGALAVVKTPREEEPQIIVPLADVMVALPGAGPREVEDRVTRPLEKLLLEIPGVEYVYSTSIQDAAVVTVRFKVGDDAERSLVRLYDALASSMDHFPAGATPPLVKSRSIDDVPILNLTLSSPQGDEETLRALAEALEEEIRTVPEVSSTEITGGRQRVLEVKPDARALAQAGLSPVQVMARLEAANVGSPEGQIVGDGRTVRIRARALLTTPEDVAAVVVGVKDGRPVRLGSVAAISEISEATDYVATLNGAAIADHRPGEHPGHSASAVTLAVAKRKGSDATRVAEAVLAKVEAVRGRILPSTVRLEVTRDYGESANEKASDLLKHLMGAILSVSVFLALALGLRGSAVVLISVPVTFALTLYTYYLFGYTLNRVTLFALIFVTGIVVDDSIIVVENIFRHLRMRRYAEPRTAMLTAIAEVGNPTVLATLTVIASVFPMAFVGGLMGPYMRPMPIGGSLAMAFSLVVALTIAPWLSKRLLKVSPHAAAEDVEEETAPPRIRRFYDRVVGPLLAQPRRGWIALGAVAGLLVLSIALIPLKVVKVKMLPFDNKSEMQVLLDLPDGTPLEATAAAARDVAAALAVIPEVTDLQVYSGTAAPVTFNGLMRHYDFRRAPELATLQVNLRDKKHRKRQSHDLAAVLRDRALPIAMRHGADLKVVEVPPGPPVLSTLVAEVYGPDSDGRLAVARKVREVMEATPGVVDVDWMVESPEEAWSLDVDPTRAALAGVAPATVAGSAGLVLSGRTVGALHPDRSFREIPIQVRWGREDRSSLAALADLRLPTETGSLVPLGAVVHPVLGTRETSLYRKNGRPVVYVVGELSGEQESPVYAILDMKKKIEALTGPRGEPVSQLFAASPPAGDAYAVKWDGEWQITREVFRDLGIAFGIVLILIYMLIAGWFQNLWTPLVMMSAVPLSLIGIIPGHWILGGFFTATSMIGVIALAGILVRNSVLLLDFVNVARERGLGLREAVLEAGAVRLRPIVLTAGTVVVGAFVILFDPIFQGLAISLMTGAIVSTGLTLVVVPVLYYLTEARRSGVA